MNKADMESHRRNYERFLAESRKAESEGLYRQAISKCLDSLEHIDGMMKHARKTQETDEFSSIPTIDMVLRYAPVLLDYESIQRLEQLLKSRRYIEKYTSQCLADKIEQAMRTLWKVHSLWGLIEANPDIDERDLLSQLKGRKEGWIPLLENLARLRLIRREKNQDSFSVSLATRLGQLCRAKCRACGGIVTAPKAALLDRLRCVECDTVNDFVILDDRQAVVA